MILLLATQRPFGAGQRAGMRNSAMAEARGDFDPAEASAAKHRFTRVVMVSSFAALFAAPKESIESLLANR
jgi:hypothetical protein